MYAAEDTKCEHNTFPYGSFSQENTCFEAAPSMVQKYVCNETHVQTKWCQKDCSSCVDARAYPVNVCIPGFLHVKYTCETKLPELEKEGIVIRLFSNDQCKVDENHGDSGTFIVKGFCMNNSAQKSMKSWYDEENNIYKQIEYDQTECRGNVVKETNFKVDVCSKVPSPFQKLMKQPLPFMKFSRK